MPVSIFSVEPTQTLSSGKRENSQGITTSSLLNQRTTAKSQQERQQQRTATCSSRGVEHLQKLDGEKGCLGGYPRNDKGEYAKIVELLVAADAIDLNCMNGPIHFDDDEDKCGPLHSVADNGLVRMSQLLMVYGADANAVSTRHAQIPGTFQSTLVYRTPADLAAAKDFESLATFLKSSAAWSQLRIAASCRFHKEATLMLRRGRMDPDASPVLEIKDALLPLPAVQPQHAAGARDPQAEGEAHSTINKPEGGGGAVDADFTDDGTDDDATVVEIRRRSIKKISHTYYCIVDVGVKLCGDPCLGVPKMCTTLQATVRGWGPDSGLSN
eukprot:gene12927-26826_t